MSRAAVLTFVNYALHPDTTGGTRVSADYPGALRVRSEVVKLPRPAFTPGQLEAARFDVRMRRTTRAKGS